MLEWKDMTADDFVLLSVLLTVVLVAYLFPGGPGTPKRLKQSGGQRLAAMSAAA